MDLLRTPEDRFSRLADFPYEPHYAELADGVRMAWVEAGPADGPVVLLLHGEPSWSYLYRSMLPVLAEAGMRAVAPDLVGFGRSDKPARREDHSYAAHVEWVRALAFDVLDLRDVTLVGQDWGGLIGLRLVAEHPDRFARVVAANTGLPTGDHDMPEVWHRFRRAVQGAADLDVGRLVASGCARGLDPVARAAYDAPFPDESFKAGPRAMPGLVPYVPDDPASEDNRRAWATLTGSDLPVLVAFSDSDPITAAMGPVLRRALPGAHGREHPTITGAGHFLQEDAGPELAAAVVELVATA
ncbi:haloalkane dehalogenase [Marmoricola endophyticus]|uniref:Haloalkane dehalogenase n=1 Tax=Marmoricola endophyticus TaxID=2040280 RepID=A0A917BB85_9ACTN|nr:haloalkane dehalogenase [Marmoricola endophyticus]GGF32214.1 haloalkane dehalogenase [Marmoricola endophyticus]